MVGAAAETPGTHEEVGAVSVLWGRNRCSHSEDRANRDGEAGGPCGEGECVSTEEAESISAGRCSHLSSTHGGVGCVLGMRQCLDLA